MATSITQESQIRLTKQRSSQTMGSPCSCTNPIIIIDDEEEETLDSKSKKTNNPREINYLGSLPSNDATTSIICKEETLEPMEKKPILESFDELSKVVNGLPKSNDPVDSCLSSTYLHEKKKDDLNEDKSVDNGYRRVTLEELGVMVEDLKSMPWELFDPIWEIRSETMDPWLDGYIKGIISPDHYNSLA